ncbi:hypothetical protein OF83DRAFT_1176506 [Amylostereum chailletii]|nr:hypothetical protein OF83DRAFT_1176506 [Amylostereum chailletii]
MPGAFGLSSFAPRQAAPLLPTHALAVVGSGNVGDIPEVGTTVCKNAPSPSASASVPACQAARPGAPASTALQSKPAADSVWSSLTAQAAVLTLELVRTALPRALEVFFGICDRLDTLLDRVASVIALLMVLLSVACAVASSGCCVIVALWVYQNIR